MISLQTALSILYALSILLLGVHAKRKYHNLNTSTLYITFVSITLAALLSSFLIESKETLYGVLLTLSLVNQLLVLPLIAKFNNSYLNIKTQLATSIAQYCHCSLMTSFRARELCDRTCMMNICPCQKV